MKFSLPSDRELRMPECTYVANIFFGEKFQTEY